MLLIDSAAFPLFVSVACCAALAVPTRWLPNASVEVSETTGAGCVPVPLSATACGLPAALSAIDTEAVLAPVAVGLKVAEIVHVAFTASVTGATGQSLVCAKSPVFAPVSPMLEIVSGAVPEFRSVAL
jgi:hypothetical protein